VTPPGTPVRVLLVDDSAVIRRFVSESLEREPDITVVATAANGRIALEKIASDLPDVVVLDIEMPVLDGLETLRALRPRWPDLPVVMYSTLTSRGATATLDALSAGATDYVLKPSHLGDADAARRAVRDELAPVLRSWGTYQRTRSVAARRRPEGAGAVGIASRTSTGMTSLDQSAARLGGAVTIAAETRPRRAARPEAVVIGSSTGGPQALTELVPRLPANLGVPVLVVQHMPPLFTRLLAERLDARSALHVVEAAPGMEVLPGTVYIAAGGTHLVVRRQGTALVTAIDDGPPENSCKPSVDVLFRSASHAFGPHVLAVVLTGMGQDGLEGARVIQSGGGVVYAQDEPSSVVWGMPGAVVRAGIAREILELSDIAPAIARALARPLSEVHA
jgi:two-component system chemotaxis response regulator CheB